MASTEHFVNDGTGWECKRCRSAARPDEPPTAAATQTPGESDSLPRFFREGEAEGGGPSLSSSARASWADAARTKLRCARCGVEERIGG